MRLILPRRAPGSFVVIWIVVVVFVLEGGYVGRRWPRSFVWFVFSLCLYNRGWGGLRIWSFFAVVEVHKTRKGLVRLTRKGLVSGVLNSSLNLSFYTLFARKSILCLLLIQGVVDTWISFRVDSQSIRLV
ncbi:hypothetical protein MtrunA17_Chr4g0028251 [Medicago truncatula]|uniref:Transmembrane protein, putative n=1 Tax=Medicago truncatula TaxID=3880 RepID=A0A072UKP1_MEDTR|nr:transmembrane protein, putative [Medicago truncatula]RHN60660.1 hypothetical protein MtrunA17_Chr4g0028251 [Medicago truncatula]